MMVNIDATLTVTPVDGTPLSGLLQLALDRGFPGAVMDEENGVVTISVSMAGVEV